MISWRRRARRRVTCSRCARRSSKPRGSSEYDAGGDEMIALNYSLVIEATAEPDFFGFYSPDLEGFTGVGHSIEDCLYQAHWGMQEHVTVLREQGVCPWRPKTRIPGSSSRMSLSSFLPDLHRTFWPRWAMHRSCQDTADSDPRTTCIRLRYRVSLPFSVRILVACFSASGAFSRRPLACGRPGRGRAVASAKQHARRGRFGSDQRRPTVDRKLSPVYLRYSIIRLAHVEDCRSFRDLFAPNTLP